MNHVVNYGENNLVADVMIVKKDIKY